MISFLVIFSVAVNATIFGDLDSDGDKDIYAKDLYINVNGTFFRLVNGSGLPTFSNTYQGGVADFDSDGIDDVYVVLNSSQNRLYINDGTGNFTYDTTYTNLRGTATDNVGFYAGLINNDSNPDLFAGDTFFQWNTTCSCYDNVTVRASLTAFSNMKQVVVVDILNRSRRDFLGVNNSGTVRYFYNLGDTNGDGVDEFSDVELVTGSVLATDANSIAVANFNPDDPTDYNISDVYISRNSANLLYLGRTQVIPGIADYPLDNATSCGVNDAADTVWTATGIFDNVSAWVPAPSNLGLARNTTDIYCANVQNDTLYTRNGTLGVGLVAFANRTVNITQNLTVVPEYAEATDLNGDAYADVIVVGSMYGSGGFVASYVTGTAPSTPPDIIYVEEWAATAPLQFESIGTVTSPPTSSDPRGGTSGGPGGLPPGTRVVDDCQFTTQIVNAYTSRMIDNADVPVKFLDRSFEFGSRYASVEDGVLTFQMTGPYDSAYSTVRVEFGVPGMSNNPTILLDVSEAPTDCGPIIETPLPIPDCSGAYLKQIPPPNTVQANVPAPGLDLTGSDLGLGAISGSAIGVFDKDDRNRIHVSLFPWNHVAFKLIIDPKTPMSGLRDLIVPIKLEARMTKKQMQEIGLEATLIRTADGVNLMAVLDTDDPEIVRRFVDEPDIWPGDFPPPTKTIDLPPEFTEGPGTIPIIDIDRTPDGIKINPIDEFGQLIGDAVDIPVNDPIVISKGPDGVTVAGEDGLILGKTFVPKAESGQAGPGQTSVYVTPVRSMIDGQPGTGPITIISIDSPGVTGCFGSGTTTQGVLSGSPKATTTIDLSSGSIEVNFQFGTTGIVAARQGVDPYTENKIFIQVEEPKPELIATLSIGTGFAIAPTVPVKQEYSKLLLAAALGLFILLVVGVAAVSRQQKRLQSSLKSVEEKTRIAEDKEDRFN